MKASADNNLDIKVSVIVPVYNTAPWLRECLDSLVNQTLREIEIICVNDGSTDDGPEILEEYGSHDGRIRIIHQENQGLSASRNVGIRAAKGKYLYFIDSDDYLEHETLEYLFSDMETRQLQFACFNVTAFADNEKNQEMAERSVPYYHRVMDENTVFKGTDLFVNLQKKGNFLAPVWLNMVLRSFCIENDLWFHTGIINEDEAWTLSAMLTADRCGCLNRTFYHRRYRDDSIMTKPLSFKNVYGYFCVSLDVIQTVEKLKIQGEELNTVVDRLEDLLTISRDNYRRCSDSEKQKSQQLPASEQFLFRQMVIAPAELREKAGQLENEIADAKKQIIQLRKENAELKKSRSYRFGRIITFLPRKVRELVKKLRLLKWTTCGQQRVVQEMCSIALSIINRA